MILKLLHLLHLYLILFGKMIVNMVNNNFLIYGFWIEEDYEQIFERLEIFLVLKYLRLGYHMLLIIGFS